VIAHVAGIPVEETFASMSGAGVTLFAVRAWLKFHSRRRR
jgi:hypothetical protein